MRGREKIERERERERVRSNFLIESMLSLHAAFNGKVRPIRQYRVRHAKRSVVILLLPLLLLVLLLLLLIIIIIASPLIGATNKLMKLIY